MLFNTFFCGGKVLLTPTIENIIFLSSDILKSQKLEVRSQKLDTVSYFFKGTKIALLLIAEKSRTGESKAGSQSECGSKEKQKVKAIKNSNF
jgi:hypothetical protein